MSEKQMSFGEYVRHATATFPSEGEPEAVRASRILSGWRFKCAQAGRSSELPEAQDAKETPEVAAQWRARALEAAQRGRAWGSWGSIIGTQQLAADWLALRGRSPSGRPLAVEVRT